MYRRRKSIRRISLAARVKVRLKIWVSAGISLCAGGVAHFMRVARLCAPRSNDTGISCSRKSRPFSAPKT